MDRHVSLRPVVESDLDLFESHTRSEEGTGSFQWFGFTPAANMRRRFSESGSIGEDGGTFTILVDGTPAGSIDWFKVQWGRRETSWCWTIGIGVFSAYRGKGIGTQAHRLIADYLFRHTRAERVQAFTDVENVHERRALEKAGFTQEGIIRCAQWRNGGWHDQVLYAALRTSWSMA